MAAQFTGKLVKVEGPARSGKTEQLLAHIASLIEGGTQPGAIALACNTAFAAQAARERLAAMAKAARRSPAKSPWAAPPISARRLSPLSGRRVHGTRAARAHARRAQLLLGRHENHGSARTAPAKDARFLLREVGQPRPRGRMARVWRGIEGSRPYGQAFDQRGTRCFPKRWHRLPAHFCARRKALLSASALTLCLSTISRTSAVPNRIACVCSRKTR